MLNKEQLNEKYMELRKDFDKIYQKVPIDMPLTYTNIIDRDYEKCLVDQVRRVENEKSS
jgi:hypothetical protein